MKTIIFVFLSIAVSLFLFSCSNDFTPVTNTPIITSTFFTPEPTGTPTMTPFPAPLQGKGGISLKISCVFGVSPQGLTLYTPVGSGYPILLIVADYQNMTYSPVASEVTDTESRVFFNNIDPGVYSLYFGVAGLEIPASYTISSINVVENETRDLGEIQLLNDCASIFTK